MTINARPILLLAPTGQVGYELQRSLSILGNVKTISRNQVDFENITALEEHIKKINPSTIINAAAYTAVDKAEEEHRHAYALNSMLPEMLAKLSLSLDSWLIHYSSDYVYAGTGENSWKETDFGEPLSVYGSSKLAGDEAIIENSTKYIIFRTSWVFAARQNNFMKTMLNLAQSRSELKIVNDQYGVPTPARLIAEVTAMVLYRVLISEDNMKYVGVYHLCPKGETTWHEFAKEIFSQAEMMGISLKVSQDSVLGISSEEYPTAATRPKNSRLDTNKIEQTFGIALPDWKSQLYLTLQEYLTSK